MARFIVNAGGAVHVVSEREFETLSLTSGYREAAPEEIAGWHRKHNLPVPPEFSTQNPTQTDGKVDEGNHADTTQQPDPATGGAPKQSRKNRRSNSG
jgi:hypothetical protein